MALYNWFKVLERQDWVNSFLLFTVNSLIASLSSVQVYNAER